MYCYLTKKVLGSCSRHYIAEKFLLEINKQYNHSLFEIVKIYSKC